MILSISNDDKNSSYDYTSDDKNNEDLIIFEDDLIGDSDVELTNITIENIDKCNNLHKTDTLNELNKQIENITNKASNSNYSNNRRRRYYNNLKRSKSVRNGIKPTFTQTTLTFKQSNNQSNKPYNQQTKQYQNNQNHIQTNIQTNSKYNQQTNPQIKPNIQQLNKSTYQPKPFVQQTNQPIKPSKPISQQSLCRRLASHLQKTAKAYIMLTRTGENLFQVDNVLINAGNSKYAFDLSKIDFTSPNNFIALTDTGFKKFRTIERTGHTKYVIFVHSFTEKRYKRAFYFDMSYEAQK